MRNTAREQYYMNGGGLPRGLGKKHIAGYMKKQNGSEAKAEK